MDADSTEQPKRNRGGRPKGSKGKSVESVIAERLDRTLAQVLRGTPSYDPRTGAPARDENGKPILRPPPASYLAVAEKRLRAVRSGTSAPSAATSDLAKEMSISQTVREAVEAERAGRGSSGAATVPDTAPQPPASPQLAISD